MTQTAMRIFVEAVGVIAPGLKDWDAARLVLNGEKPYRTAPLEVLTPASLPPAERRRSCANVRLAIAAAEQVLSRTPLAPQEMAMVFSSREAAGVITHQICEVLASTREVSPTQFHNSVHNAPSGYFSIAMNAKLAASSVCGGAWSFAAGMLNAVTQALVDNLPVLYVCYDSPLPSPLNKAMPVLESTAIALVLTPAATAQSMATWEIAIGPGNDNVLTPDWMPAIWGANASAYGFSVLATLVNASGAVLALSPDLRLRVVRC